MLFFARSRQRCVEYFGERHKPTGASRACAQFHSRSATHRRRFALSRGLCARFCTQLSHSLFDSKPVRYVSSERRKSRFVFFFFSVTVCVCVCVCIHKKGAALGQPNAAQLTVVFAKTPASAQIYRRSHFLWVPSDSDVHDGDPKIASRDSFKLSHTLATHFAVASSFFHGWR